MSLSPLLGITEMEASQAQPELIVNEAIRKLEAVSPLQVLDRDLSTPPASPADGDRYIVGGSPTGDWAGQQNNVALNINGVWHFLTPRPGWLAYVEDEALRYEFIPGSPTGWAVWTP
jgi:hypothetical protein